MEACSAPSSKGNNMRSKASRKGVRIIGKIRDFKESENRSTANSHQISISREADHASVILHDQANGRRDTYILDGCYEQEESTSTLFAQEVKPLLQGIFRGDNCCVIAYGARGSGKSQLIQGSVEAPGLTIMAFCDIFSDIKKFGGSIDISCYEIYNDHIYDLLEYKEQEVHIMEDAEKAIRLNGLSKVPVKSLTDFVNLYFHISNQSKLRLQAENDANVKSHRGLIMYITSVDKESKNVGKLNFVDLAGYEDVQKRVDAKPSVAECSKINKSLYALLNVSRALNNDETYIPYRQVKLTRLLQDFLCGMNNTVLITCLNPIPCPHTSRAISMASSSCQFVNRQKHDFAKNSKECRRKFSTGLSAGVRPTDSTMKKRENYGLGLSGRKIMENPPTLNGSTLHNTKVEKRGLYNLGLNGMKIKNRFSTSEGRTVDSTMATRKIRKLGSSGTKIKENQSTSKERKLLNVARPLSNYRKPVNLYSKEESAGSNVISVSSALREEISPAGRSAELFTNTKDVILSPKDDTEPADHIQHRTDTSLTVDMKLSLIAEGFSPENGQQKSCFGNEQILSISDEQLKEFSTSIEQLRELSNRFKAFSSQPISSRLDHKSIPESIEPKTPRLPLASKLDHNSIRENFTTPQEKFKARSTGLKKSLVKECLDYLNSASKEELKQLKGIGEKRSSYILELREETPEPFKNIDDLKEMGLSSKQIKGMMTKIIADI